MSQLLSFGSVISYIGYLCVAILILLLMVTIHEFGHYCAGKMLKFKIDEFSVGFGKALFQKKNKKTGEVFSLRLFPLGGYCAFAGENEDGSSEGSFNSQKPWKRLIVFFAGAFFNFLSAIIFSFILLVSFGYEHVQITGFADFSPNVGKFEVGDVVYKVGDKDIDFVYDRTFTALISEYKLGDSIQVTVKRNGKMVTIDDVQLANVGTAEEPVLKLGVNLKTYRYSFLESLALCVPFTLRWCWKIMIILWMLITGKLGLSNVGGPITTVTTIATYSRLNPANLLLLLPVIATNLAVFNLLPFPALDGSHMVFTTIEWIRGKPINRKVENTINNVGLIILLGFVVLVDILHFLV